MARKLTITRSQALLLGFSKGWFIASIPATLLLIFVWCINPTNVSFAFPVLTSVSGGFGWLAYSRLLDDVKKQRANWLNRE